MQVHLTNCRRTRGPRPSHAVGYALAALTSCSLSACAAPHEHARSDSPAPTTQASDAVNPAPRPTPVPPEDQNCSVAVVVTAGSTPIREVEVGITTRDGAWLALFAAASDAPSQPVRLPPGRYWVLAERLYPAAPEATWQFSGVKQLLLTKPGERVTVEIAVPGSKTVPFRVDPPQDSGVDADFFEYVDVELDQPKWNTIFTDFQGDSFEVRGRVPVGKTLPLPALPPGEYTVYVKYAAERSLWTPATDGPGEWVIPSVASHGDTITFPVPADGIVLRPSLGKEDQEALRTWAERAGQPRQ
jgi:hypothetical protein